MDDYTSDFRGIFDEVSEEQLRKDPRLIVPYLRDLNVDPILIRMIETMVLYSKTDFLASVTCSVEKVQGTVERMASRIYADRDSLFQLINMIRDARGIGVVAVQPVVAKAASMNVVTPSKSALKTIVKPVVNTVPYWDSKRYCNLMKAVDGSAYYSEDLKELVRCDKNTTVLVMPDSVESIDIDAFEGCLKLREIYFPESMTTIKCYLEDCCLLNTVHIPDTVTKLDDGCFQGCTSLVNVDLPSSLMMIEYNAFDRCSSLTEITIPDSVVVVKGFAFDDCNSLKKVTIQGANTILEDYAFSECDNLKDVYIPRGLKLSEDSISGCDKCTVHRI